ncbi:DUF547 domain-containing protein [Meiothermus hypogaeus]|uniref:DUF547 domain-containing protein n=2 Tax=Meiothermus hypogaeus TaxID=884155 RepID=A0A511R1T2_9DEIN|nr:DUF547 domain-containing protein [Meiothermus hypogaeus]RIH76035.1 hypothetical protein Mhypo_02644 [Meiothermus hypogaeus]GEM83267.1 DUF547 domain-containing protein [Meiothermus hypogaeus NBRC 106114]
MSGLPSAGAGFVVLENSNIESRWALELRELITCIKAQHIQQDGRLVDYANLKNGPLWRELQDRIHQLRGLKPTAWLKQVQRAFWINLYNVLVLHAVVVRGHPGQNPLRQLVFFLRKDWVIGGHRWSLDDIEHGILRGNRRNPFLPFAPFGPGDPRQQYSLSLDARVHFALNCGAKSCPPIGVYSAESLEKQLDLATAAYLLSEVEFQGQTLKLPRLLWWYQVDFGGRRGIANLLAQHLGREVSEITRMRWVYRPYDWSVNAI